MYDHPNLKYYRYVDSSGTWTWVDDAWHHITVSTTTSAGVTSHNIYMDGKLLPPSSNDEDYDEGGAGVREPRRPYPPAPSAAAAEPEPELILTATAV